MMIIPKIKNNLSLSTTTMNTIHKIYHHRQIFRKKPWVAQALWVIPVLGLSKNLVDTLIIGKDIVSERKFWVKEKFFKTLSALFSLWFWRVVILYSTHEYFNTYLLLSLTTALQAGNWGSYIVGVYFSGELQQILKNNKESLKNNTSKVVHGTKIGANKVLSTTKKGAQSIWNTIRNITKHK